MLNFAIANRPRAALGTFALALLALAAPATAATPPSDSGKVPAFGLEMNVRSSHGYSIRITAEDHRRVTVSASKGGTFASYTVPGRATSDRVEANLGKLGRVSVHFTPSVAKAGLKRRCQIRGHFDGLIRFRGEQGYTKATARSAAGQVSPGSNPRCQAQRTNTRLGPGGLLAKGAEPDLTFTAFGAAARTGGRQVVFYDAELNEVVAGQVVPLLAIPIASVEEQRGRIEIGRGAIRFLERTVTTPSPPGQVPQTASVRAPKPFQGTGSYLAAPGAEPSWSGDFSVELPGAGLVPLTGPEFDALLCTGAPNKRSNACLNDLEDLIGLAEQGSAPGGSAFRPMSASASPFFK